MDEIPAAYGEALREAERLFESGEMTVALFTVQWEKAWEAVKGSPFSGDVMEGLLLFAPPGFTDDDT